MNNWTEEVDKLLHVAHYCTTLQMNRKFAYNLVDRSLRAASDVLSAQCTNVVNNTASVIQWTTQWSEKLSLSMIVLKVNLLKGEQVNPQLIDKLLNGEILGENVHSL